MSLLHCQQLGITIGHAHVCDGLELPFENGQSWAILGRNGSGKTTLIHTLAGLRPPQQGNILLDGQTLHKHTRRQLARRIGVLFQDESVHFPASVLEYTLMGRHPHIGWLQGETQRDIAIAEQALQQTDLLQLKQRDINTLSGGERRRVNIACLLAQDPGIALLDEPGNHLDLQHQVETLSLIREHYRQRLLIMSAHDINLAARFCTHALLLFGNGETLHGEFNEVVNVTSLQRLYGIAVNSISADGHTLYYPA